MNTNEFLRKCWMAWPKADGKPLKQEMMDIYVDKMKRFSDSEIDQIYSMLLEKCHTFPKLSHVFEAAKDLGLQTAQAVKIQDRLTWMQTDCPLCSGEGAIQVIFNICYLPVYAEGTVPSEENQIGVKKNIRFQTLWPLSSGENLYYEMQEGDYSYVFRCDCDAGTQQPGGWPRWDRNRGADRQKLAPSVEGKVYRGGKMVDIGHREEKTVPIQATLDDFLSEWDDVPA